MTEIIKKIFKRFPLAFAVLFFCLFVPAISLAESPGLSGVVDLSAGLGEGASCQFDANGNGTIISSDYHNGQTCIVSRTIIGVGQPDTWQINVNGVNWGTINSSWVSLDDSEPSLYENLFSGVLGVITSLLIILLPYALTLFAIMFAIKFGRKFIKWYTAVPADIQRAREIRAETDSLLGRH